MANNEFRQRVQGVSNQAIELLEKSVSGKTNIEGGLMDRLIRIVSQGIKVEHMNQLENQNNRSFGLRLLGFLPKDDESRKKYIEMTNPDLKTIFTPVKKQLTKK